MEDPYASVDESDRRLDELLEAFEARDDRRSMFLTVYSRVTEAVGKRIDRGGFEEPDWVADYLVTFANLYREAVHDFEAGNLNALADPWQLAFEAAEQEGYHALRHVALGINAHINYDLALALDEVGIERNRGRKRADHAAVNEVLGRLVDGNQDRPAENYDPSIVAIDESLGDLDDLFSILTIDECRDSAWRTAVALSSPLAVRRRFAMWVARHLDRRRVPRPEHPRTPMTTTLVATLSPATPARHRHRPDPTRRGTYSRHTAVPGRRRAPPRRRPTAPRG